MPANNKLSDYNRQLIKKEGVLFNKLVIDILEIYLNH